MCRTFLATPDDVGLGVDTETGEEVSLRYEDRVLGTTMIGKSGTGKSTVLENLILTDLANGTPGMVIDPHAQLADRVIRRATPGEAERIILLEAIRTKPFGLNLLAVRDPVDEDDDPVTWAADSVVGAVKRLYGEVDEFLPRFERYLDLAVRTLIPSRLTLLEAPRLFTDKPFRNACLLRVPDTQERESLRAAWAAFDRLRPGEQITHTEALVNRLERLLAPPLIQGIVGCKQTTVPFDQVLSGDKMLIVSLPSERLSPERCNFIGALLLCALADRIFTRRVIEKPPRLHLYLDEYQRFATTTTSDLLTQGRAYEVGLTLAHQDLHQIRDSFIRNSARHAGTLILLAVTRPDAEDFAGEFPLKPRQEWIETLTEFDGTEPKLILSPTAAEDVYVDGHSNPDVDLAARSFLRGMFVSSINPEPPRLPRGFAVGVKDSARGVSSHRLPSDPGLRTTYKSSNVSPRPGGVAVDSDVAYSALLLNGLLFDAMTNPRATDPDVFIKAIQINNLVFRGKLGQDLLAHYGQDRLQAWLRAYGAHLGALRSGNYINEFLWADWALEPISFESVLGSADYRARLAMLVKLRERLRWLWILYEGLAKDPVLIPSGEQQDRKRTRYIVHPAQTQQDALNEFAGKLVHPPEQHVAHVRMPQAYHEVKLAGPMAETAPPGQVGRVRRRSQEEYHRPDRGNEPEEPDKPQPQEEARPKPPRITRRPRAQLPATPEEQPQSPEEVPLDENGDADDGLT